MEERGGRRRREERGVNYLTEEERSFI